MERAHVERRGTDSGLSAPGRPSTNFLGAIPRDFARKHLILSGGESAGAERLLVSEQSDPTAVFNVGVRLRRTCTTEVVDGADLARLIDEAYSTAERARAQDTEPVESADIDRLLESADRDLLSTSGKGPIVQLVDALLLEASARGASDVHIQPQPDRVLVRYRVDGVLHTSRELPTRAGPAIISRIKVMGRMDIAERRLAQDGRATVTLGSGSRGARSIDLRISTFPTNVGERVVIRLLERRGPRLDSLESLGMPAEMRRRYLERASRANGIILVTGPTGSGKTTTLYATLRWLTAHRAGEINVMTIEDPVEYDLSGEGAAISQAQVNGKRGVTFASGLRHILRQDPDVVMVGEVRDAETARIAIQASLTGHLVLSTVHTNDAVSTVTRLVDLGIEAYLVSDSLSAVLAQRLVRCRHAACAGGGCPECHGSGLSGRIGVFELLVIDETLRRVIARAGDSSGLRAAARQAGMQTLVEEGLRLVQEGTTTHAEVLRVVQAEDA